MTRVGPGDLRNYLTLFKASREGNGRDEWTKESLVARSTIHHYYASDQ